MSIRGRVSLHPDNRSNPHVPVTGARGFTLIELLVVVAIISILMSILLPSLRCARESARSSVCGQKLKDMGNSLTTFFTENRDAIPGVNTTGVAVSELEGLKDWWTQPGLPVQTFDWMTPILKHATALPSTRTDRMHELINRWRCPSQKFYKAVFYPPGLNGSPDKQELIDKQGGWTALSYLMPIHFQYWGTLYAKGQPHQLVIGTNKANPARKIYPATAPPDGSWEASTLDYKSYITKIGNPAQKVAVADGTRYLDDTLLLDFDPHPVPGIFGSFTSSGGWWAGDTSYGVRQGSRNYNGGSVSRGSPGKGLNLELSYRHGCRRGSPEGSAITNTGRINVLFFDGSVRPLNDRRSRDAVLWYPRGAVVNNTSNCMNTDFKTGDRIP
jgi:prepilin-type N-terminal cleavage/methylation domain-containing protein/prepilin-type processing-associated H-X9-DG protein